jgi:hypothetical protein
VRSPGAIRCGWVSWSGCPNWHSAAETSVLMAGRTSLLLRKGVRGLGRHACMLACRGRNSLLLMVVDMERRKEEPKGREASKCPSPIIVTHWPTSLHKPSSRKHCLLLWKHHPYCTTTHLHVHAHIHAHIAHESSKPGHKKPLRHITAGCCFRSPIEVTGEVTNVKHFSKQLESHTPAIWLPRNATLLFANHSFLASYLNYVQPINTLFEVNQEQWLHPPPPPSKHSEATSLPSTMPSKTPSES